MKPPIYFTLNGMTYVPFLVSKNDAMGAKFYITDSSGIEIDCSLTKNQIVNLIAALSNYLAEEEIPKLEKYSPIGT